MILSPIINAIDVGMFGIVLGLGLLYYDGLDHLCIDLYVLVIYEVNLICGICGGVSSKRMTSLLLFFFMNEILID